MIYTRGRIRSSLRHLPLRLSLRGTAFHRYLSNQPTTTDAINAKLQSILETEPTPKVFQFLVQNHTRVDPEFSLTFTYNLLQQNNLQAAISLQHLLLSNENYQISNEVWTIILNKVCLESNYLGAMLIFHELVDNHRFYDEVSFAVPENDQIPFIMSPQNLVHLAMIFTNNGDAKRMQGILRYFRRFYAYLDNQDAYQSLLALNVEVYAEMGDLTMALTKFQNLAFASRVASRRKQRAKLRKEFTDFNQWRLDNIKSNQYRFDFIPTYPLDIHQQLLAQICQSGIYNPVIQYNVYTSPISNSSTSNNLVSSSIAIIQNPIASSDLPRFQHLITEYIKQEELYEYDKLLQFMKPNHYSLHIFVIAALCDLDKHKIAFTILKSLASYGQRLCKSPAFITLLQTTHNRPELYPLRLEILKYYRSLNKGHVNYPVAAYV
ncbi:hypothetical protein CANMA_000198 [Candida margitis]|uniref:uncharacterized protein n=1 Tax=Candida margitis TaxID=1775924 RepID=UPI0022280281|nr:uncharacterized protein CANMA_000198 [Candida margitis]KAI5970779.1 hypothetical protein CANMA_000198 [Candida margitis]